MSSDDDPLVGFGQTTKEVVVVKTETTVVVSERLYDYLSEQSEKCSDGWAADNGIRISADYCTRAFVPGYDSKKRVHLSRRDFCNNRVVFETYPCCTSADRKRIIADFPLIKEALTQAANEARGAHKRHKPNLFDDLETI